MPIECWYVNFIDFIGFIMALRLGEYSMANCSERKTCNLECCERYSTTYDVMTLFQLAILMYTFRINWITFSIERLLCSTRGLLTKFLKIYMQRYRWKWDYRPSKIQSNQYSARCVSRWWLSQLITRHNKPKIRSVYIFSDKDEAHHIENQIQQTAKQQQQQQQ